MVLIHAKLFSLLHGQNVVHIFATNCCVVLANKSKNHKSQTIRLLGSRPI